MTENTIMDEREIPDGLREPQKKQPETLGSLLRNYRREANITQRELSDRLYCAFATICQVENDVPVGITERFLSDWLVIVGKPEDPQAVELWSKGR